jgi:mono/diheme cytochrome c family protein
MRGHHVAALGLGLSALFASSFDFFVGSGLRPALAARIDDDDDDDENPRKGPKLAAGQALGLALTLEAGGKRDVREARLVALGVPAGTPPSPFLPAGPFRATWQGSLNVPFRGECSFSAEGRGTLKVELNGKKVLEGSGDDLATAEGKTAKLKKGANALVVTYDSPPSGDAFVRLSWTPEDAPREPVPPTSLAHEVALAPLVDGLRLREGRELIANLRCLKCHAPASGTLPTGMPELATDAPSLAEVGSRLQADWMARWIADPKALRPSATMPKMFHGGAGQARDVAAYLASLAGTKPDPEPAADADAATEGGRLFANLGCIGCHTRPDRDDWASDPKRVPLRFVGAKWKPAALVAFLRQPDRHYAWIKMPNFHLSGDEAGRIAAYLASPPKVNLAPPEPEPTPADPLRGRALVETSGCLDCHALPGSTNAAKAPSFAAIPADLRAIGCLAPSGDAERKAPDFGLSDGKRAALLAFAAAGLDSLTRDAAPEFAERQVKALNCASCHKRDGSDDAWTDLQVEVASLLEGAPAEEKDPDGLPYPAAQVRPPLTWIGEKLKPEWSAAFIAGQVPYKPRPYLRARMPAFAVRAEGLAHGLALGHGYPTTSPPDAPADPDLIPVAQQLVGNMGLNCVSCHNIGKTPAVGVFEAPGVNFMHARERLRPSYAARWLRAPIRIDPETKMPSYFNGEASVLPTILDGKADKQIDALWNYLLQGPAIEPPPR